MLSVFHPVSAKSSGFSFSPDSLSDVIILHAAPGKIKISCFHVIFFSVWCLCSPFCSSKGFNFILPVYFLLFQCTVVGCNEDSHFTFLPHFSVWCHFTLLCSGKGSDFFFFIYLVLCFLCLLQLLSSRSIFVVVYLLLVLPMMWLAQVHFSLDLHCNIFNLCGFLSINASLLSPCFIQHFFPPFPSAQFLTNSLYLFQVPCFWIVFWSPDE